MKSASFGRARTLLYVPGHRSDRFAKAARSGADEVVLDLEDSVAPDSKRLARRAIHNWLTAGGIGAVRINGKMTPWHEDDLAMVRAHQCVVILPKVGAGSEVVEVARQLPSGSCVVPLVETAVGILGVRDICSSPGVLRVIFGSADLAAELGVDHADPEALAHARWHLVIASAAVGIAAPIDGASSSIANVEKLKAECAHAVALGFGGKSCIHPSQLPIVRAAFTPSTEAIQRARAIVQAAGDGSATVLNGEIVAKPIVERARRLLAEQQMYPGIEAVPR